MRVDDRIARARLASGRFLALLGLLALPLLASCRTVGGGARADAGPPPLVVAPGPISEVDRAEADRLWASAQRSFEARRFFEVIRTTTELLDRFPASEASGQALRMMAEAHLEAGETEEADRVAERYLGLLPPNDPRGAGARLLQARALQDDPAGQLDRLLRIDAGASEVELAEAAQLTRAAADSLDYRVLESVVEDVGVAAGPLAPLAQARLAVDLLEMNRADDAYAYASRALEGGASGQELVWVEGVLRGELPPGRGRVTDFSIGLVLPTGGSPALADFAASVAEGVELAAATVLGEEYHVTVVTRDDEGDAELAAQAVTDLESEGVAGIVGLLQDEVLVSAGMARISPVPIVSPTARSAERSGEAVYSLEGADPGAAESIARYAAARAFQRLAIVHPETPAATAEADAFEATAARLGMPVVGRFTYEPGATFFEPQIIAARNALRRAELDSLQLAEDDTLHMETLEPAAIFFPIPPEDVEFLAPQVVHFGLDTLAIEILGTSGWTDPQALASVDARNTNGVVATAAAGGGPGSAGDERFRREYEEFYQRTLVGSTPSIGYDAALLLLEALRPGRIAPEQVEASFARLSDVEGANGVYSIVSGRVVRRTEVVRIQDRATVPEPEGYPEGPRDPGASENR